MNKSKIKMGDVENINGNNINNQVDTNIRVVAPLVPEAVLYDWAQPTTDNMATAIAVPLIQDETFQITNNMLHLLQNKGLFFGFYIEDLHQHLKNFLSICVTQRQPNMTPEAIRLFIVSILSAWGGSNVDEFAPNNIYCYMGGTSQALLKQVLST